MKKIKIVRPFSHVDLWELVPKKYEPGQEFEAVEGKIIGEGQCSMRCATLAMSEGWAIPSAQTAAGHPSPASGLGSERSSLQEAPASPQTKSPASKKPTPRKQRG
jgi:hypothetical protein